LQTAVRLLQRAEDSEQRGVIAGAERDRVKHCPGVHVIANF
jgi:hypothetical protein